VCGRSDPRFATAASNGTGGQHGERQGGRCTRPRLEPLLYPSSCFLRGEGRGNTPWYGAQGRRTRMGRRSITALALAGLARRASWRVARGKTSRCLRRWTAWGSRAPRQGAGEAQKLRWWGVARAAHDVRARSAARRRLARNYVIVPIFERLKLQKFE
jgi:hypothetical protein